eukprot:TRINITY_DN34516_c0_g1_i1.p1 TRINITY_DN34516_c0_g1~~TRINITY_DN34516_c0_g1_i1.p1  ORF type:complete len:683 (+),score=186.18 TRINITY_DN34516_c0_g1_i1:480-2528(+)
MEWRGDMQFTEQKDDDAEHLNESDKSIQRTIKRRIKVVTVYLLVVVIYLVLGGALMHFFESDRESKDRGVQEGYVLSLVANMSRDQMAELERLNICNFPGEASIQWTFTGSVFYSLTVITTIGYGSFAPKTLGGRTFTVFYAMFGISVIGILLSNLALVIAGLLRSIASRTFAGKRGDKSKQLQHAAVAQQCLSAAHPICLEELRSLIMHLHDVKESDWDEAHEGCILSDITNRYQNDSGLFDREAVMLSLVRWGEVQRNRPAKGSVRFLAFLFGMCCAWIMAWAFVFMMIEGWGYFDSVWYACITLSTIGFGDFVPESIAGRLAAFAFITPGIGMVAALISSITNWFEIWRFWSLQKLHGQGKVSDKIMVAQGVSVMLKPEESVHRRSPSPPRDRQDRERLDITTDLLKDSGTQISITIDKDIDRSMEQVKGLNVSADFSRIESAQDEERECEGRREANNGSFAESTSSHDSLGRPKRLSPKWRGNDAHLSDKASLRSSWASDNPLAEGEVTLEELRGSSASYVPMPQGASAGGGAAGNPSQYQTMHNAIMNPPVSWTAGRGSPVMAASQPFPPNRIPGRKGISSRAGSPELPPRPLSPRGEHIGGAGAAAGGAWLKPDSFDSDTTKLGLSNRSFDGDAFSPMSPRSPVGRGSSPLGSKKGSFSRMPRRHMTGSLPHVQKV